MTLEPAEMARKLDEAQELLSLMVMELRFRGCEDSHPLIRQAMDLGRWLGRAARQAGEEGEAS